MSTILYGNKRGNDVLLDQARRAASGTIGDYKFGRLSSEWTKQTDALIKKKRDVMQDIQDEAFKNSAIRTAFTQYTGSEAYIKSRNDAKLLDTTTPEFNDEYRRPRLFCYHFLRAIAIVLMFTLIVFGALYITDLSVPIENTPQLTTLAFEFLFA